MSASFSEHPRATPRVLLREAAEINPKMDRSSLSDDTPVSFVPMAAVGPANGRIDVSTVRPYREVKKGYTNFRDGDVLFAKVTPCMENGKMAVANRLQGGLGFGSTEFHVLRPRTGVDPHYVYYYVSSEHFRKEAARHMTGAVGLRRVPTSFLEEAEIPLPDVDVQRCTVAEIEKQFSRLDEAVANFRRVSSNLRRYRESVVNAAVEGRLAYIHAPAFHPRAQDGRSIPEEWKPVHIRTVASIDVGFAFKSSDFSKAGVPLLRGENIEPGSLRWAETRYWPEDRIDAFKNLMLREGDIILAMDRPVVSAGLKLARVRARDVPSLLVQRVARLRGVDSRVDPFLYLVMSSGSFRRHLLRGQTGTQLPHVSASTIGSFSFSFPPLAEQERIVAEVDRRLSIVREVEAEVDANLKRAQALRQAILAKAFGG